METYEEVAKHHELDSETSKRFIKYMRTRWPGESLQCQIGYASEWAMRFKQGLEMEASDIMGQAILRIEENRAKLKDRMEPLNYVNLHGTLDAKIWAYEFVKRFGGDEGLMIGWFANAIMAGFDEATRREEAKLKRYQEALNIKPAEARRIWIKANGDWWESFDELFKELRRLAGIEEPNP